MSIDYVKVGLKSGLEIHQQIDSGKLFCRCPGYLRQDKPDYEIKRKLHAIAGESGEVDEAVKHEAALDREFVYQGYKDNCCLIELDEEPPKMINSEALDEVLKIALLLNCEIYTNTQVMRKTVIDGSNTSGFQRTFLIGHDGFIETSFGKVAVDTIALEEDSARPGTSDNVEGDSKTRVWKLDRLGIPLVEIMTKPEMNNPEQIKECALKIGEILRACKVKRGIGTIRQDVNISIKGHDRVEIKGFQEPGMMIKTVDLEILRQQKEITEGKSKGEVRGTLESGETKFNRPMPGSARMYPETDLPLLKIPRSLINEVKKNLPQLREDAEKEFEKIGLNQEMIQILFKQNKIEEFKELLKILNEPNLIAKILLVYPREIASHEKKTQKEVEKMLNKDTLTFVVEKLRDKKISKEHLKSVLEKIVKGEEIEEAVSVKKQDIENAEEKIMKIIKAKPGLSENAYMGIVMKEIKGISGKEAIEAIKKLLNK